MCDHRRFAIRPNSRGSAAGYKAKVAAHLKDQEGHFKASQGYCPTMKEGRNARGGANERVDRQQ